MPERRKPKGRFEWMEMSDAAQECNTQRQQVGANCPACQLRVILHCTLCQIQVTACLCSTVDKWGQDEAFRRMVEQFGEEITREHYRRAGLIIPGAPAIHIPRDN